MRKILVFMTGIFGFLFRFLGGVFQGIGSPFLGPFKGVLGVQEKGTRKRVGGEELPHRSSSVHPGTVNHFLIQYITRTTSSFLFTTDIISSPLSTFFPQLTSAPPPRKKNKLRQSNKKLILD